MRGFEIPNDLLKRLFRKDQPDGITKPFFKGDNNPVLLQSRPDDRFTEVQ